MGDKQICIETHWALTLVSLSQGTEMIYCIHLYTSYPSFHRVLQHLTKKRWHTTDDALHKWSHRSSKTLHCHFHVSSFINALQATDFVCFQHCLWPFTEQRVCLLYLWAFCTISGPVEKNCLKHSFISIAAESHKVFWWLEAPLYVWFNAWNASL